MNPRVERLAKEMPMFPQLAAEERVKLEELQQKIIPFSGYVSSKLLDDGILVFKVFECKQGGTWVEMLFPRWIKDYGFTPPYVVCGAFGILNGDVSKLLAVRSPFMDFMQGVTIDDLDQFRHAVDTCTSACDQYVREKLFPYLTEKVISESYLNNKEHRIASVKTGVQRHKWS